MSEVAAAELSAIAAVEAGSLTVSYERDADGRYFSIFTSRSCKRPGTSQPQLAAYRTEQQQATAVQLERLKELADADRSGFVSTREGTAVAQLVKFAWQATYITEQEGPDLPRVARAMGMPPQKFTERLWSYRNLLQRNHGRDPKLRDIPL
ncbi:MAG TPA: hypothetical protein VMM92_16570 [Thermoanaerobaculia bacterium]|nr:hypothetical protein [Thermoanaerobaculia bacterium]